MARRSKADWTAEDLVRQGEAAAALVEYLKTANDDADDIVNDIIEGESDFLETIDRALDQIAEADMMTKALKEREATLASRRKRFEGKAGFLRNCIEMAMLQANGDTNDRPLPFTLTTPSATVTLKEGKSKVLITDEASLPTKFFKSPPPVVDKGALNEYVKEWLAFWDDPEAAGALIEDEEDAPPRFPEDLPDGVELSDAGFSLAIRRN